MKTNLKVMLGVLLIFVSSTVAAIEEHHGAHALQHTTLAVIHGEQGHTKFIQEHAKEALKHVKQSAQVHHQRHLHLMKAVKLLESSINKTNKNKPEDASEDANKALVHIHKSLQ